MYAAYDALSDKMKNFLGGLTAVHSSEQVHGRMSREENLRDGVYPKNEHPVIRTHPETGRKALYVNRAFTSHIRGLKRPESQALLGFLYQHAEKPDFQCRFHWETNSVAFWDNRCTHHLAVNDYDGLRRVLDFVSRTAGCKPA